MTGTGTERQDRGTVAAEPDGRRDRLYRRLLAEVAAANLPAEPDATEAVTPADLAGLPAAAQRYLRFMGVPGRPRDRSFRVRLAGRFRLRPGGGWMPMRAWQYNTAVPVARVFVIRVRMAGVLPMVASDTYLRGHGRMLGKLLNLVTVADGKGDEYDVSELLTWLDDAVLLAPSMLLTPAVSWARVDGDSFDVALTDSGHTVTARVFLDPRGAPVDIAADRYATLPDGLRPARWRTPIHRWDTVDGRPFPGATSVIYDLPGGPFCYLEGAFAADSFAVSAPAGRDAGTPHGTILPRARS